MGKRQISRRLLSLWLFVGLLASTPAAALDPKRSIVELFHRAYTRDEGLPGAVYGIAQTPDGYLWLGATSGLYRFDGVRFERMLADRLISSDIYSLTATSSGDLWVGYADGGLSRIRDGVVVDYPAGAGGTEFSTQRILEAPKGGGLWAQVGFTPWRFDGRAWREVPGPWAPPTEKGGGVWSMEPGRDGVFWAKDGASVFYCRPGCTRFARASGYAGGVMGLARDRDGRVWTSDTRAPGRMYAMPELTAASDAAVPEPAYGGQISQHVHGRIFLDRDGTLWNINPQHGLQRVRSVLGGRADPTQLDTFDASNGLTSNEIQKLYEDKEGDIWVGASEGLDLFRPANIVPERRPPVTASKSGYEAGVVGGNLYLFVSAPEDINSPFTGHFGALYRIAAGGSQLILPKMEQPYAMEPANDGGLWIGNYRGLFRLKGDTLISEPLPPNVQKGRDLAVLGVAESVDGELWVSILENGLWRRANGVWSQVVAGRADQGSYWGNMSLDGRGVLWMADHHSVVRVANGHLLTPPVTASLNVGEIATMHVDDQGTWFGGEFGLARFDGRAFHTLRSERLPELAFVSGIVQAKGYTWITSEAGILRFETSALERAMARPGAPMPRFDLFDRRDGVAGEIQRGVYTNSDSNVFQGADGRLWFLTDRGVVWTDPSNLYRNALPPPVAIRSLTANGRTYTSPHDLRLAAGVSNLEINYAALSFVEPSRVRFRYKLDGVDKDWVDPGERRQVFYTRLGAGTYHFRVIAANDAGVWNRTGAVFTFTIAPTFLQSIWFKILAALVLAGLAWLAFTLRLRQETARLQSSFNVRVAERERIARELHDTLLQGFQGLMLRFQSVANRVPAGDALRDSIEDALNRADAVLAEGRARVRELRSSAASDDLSHSLAEAASNIIVGETPRFHLTVEGSERRLNALVGEEVLRIFEEALRNVIEHANAKKIDVLLTFGRQGLRLAVTDDGVGMAQSILIAGQRAGHYGLIGMRERAERVHGRLDVTSREGAGTEVVFSAPARAAYRERAWPDAIRSVVRTGAP